MDCRLMAGVDLWRAKLPKVAAEGRIGPPPPSLAASAAAPLEDNYTLRAAKVRSRSRDGSSVGDALAGELVVRLLAEPAARPPAGPGQPLSLSASTKDKLRSPTMTCSASVFAMAMPSDYFKPHAFPGVTTRSQR
ncbi:hypothetical protein PCANC_22367 [Puccinia coronata f. sp. avenae]|uniref:Uncharacterized protein n=1 Tax=Puccinia coronata f. sp. avenae TaxID=200324 RepID=A0A2N5U1X8_9BASI|nr:hypothetical protein PCANC_22367 [Puccinia coronata f. sp. avenae]